jgi:hypothetical protein
MGRSSYENWVPEEDRKRFFRIEQTIGELDNNPFCREASSTLFWQIYFILQNLKDPIDLYRNAQAIAP